MTWQAFEASDADRGEVAYSHLINLNYKNQPKIERLFGKNNYIGILINLIYPLPSNHVLNRSKQWNSQSELVECRTNESLESAIHSLSA